MKHKVVIVEDEEFSLSRLERLMESFAGDYHVAGKATDGLDAVDKITQLRPDLVFLDIRLPGLDGFKVLEKLDKQPFIIFTTAFKDRALDAFKTNAIDYLLKPIELDTLGKSLAKFQAMVGKPLERMKNLAELIRSLDNPYLSRIPCKVGERTYLVKAGEILYFQAENKYTSVQTSSKSYLIDTPLVELEKQLDPRDFIRIHRGILVNITWIAEIRRKFDGKVKVVMLNRENTELPASRMFADNLRSIR